jgi:hypothetical protein
MTKHMSERSPTDAARRDLEIDMRPPTIRPGAKPLGQPDQRAMGDISNILRTTGNSAQFRPEK